MLKLEIGRLNELFSLIAKNAALYLPIKRAGKVDFDLFKPGDKAEFDEMTVKSAKDLFFPQSENLMEFRMTGKSIEVKASERADEPFVVFGVRACDARSFDILDMVFLSDPVDTHYHARRNAGTVVSLGCLEPWDTCFCATFGIDLAEPQGDAQAWILNGNLYLEAVSEKGAALLKTLGPLMREAYDSELKDAKNAARAKIKEKPLSNLDLTGFDGDHMMELFESPHWKRLSQACLGCGTCTFVCPTCQCYDIRDFDTGGGPSAGSGPSAGNGVQRYRCWDSCMYSDFTLMAHGNPRKTQLERFRQRFMHKLSYFPANNKGMYSCVGCGRCVAKCPTHLHIAKAIRTLGGKGK